jgi:hypothetical protein
VAQTFIAPEGGNIMLVMTHDVLENGVETNNYFEQLFVTWIAETEAEKANTFQQDEVGTYKFLGFRPNREAKAANQGYQQDKGSTSQMSAENSIGYRFLGLLD